MIAPSDFTFLLLLTLFAETFLLGEMLVERMLRRAVT